MLSIRNYLSEKDPIPGFGIKVPVATPLKISSIGQLLENNCLPVSFSGQCILPWFIRSQQILLNPLHVQFLPIFELIKRRIRLGYVLFGTSERVGPDRYDQIHNTVWKEGVVIMSKSKCYYPL